MKIHRVLFCIGLNSFAEMENCGLDRLDEDLRYFSNEKGNIQICFCLFPGDIQQWRIVSVEATEIIEKIFSGQSVMRGILDAKVLDMFDEYYGDVSPNAYMMLRMGKKVTIR